MMLESPLDTTTSVANGMTPLHGGAASDLENRHIPIIYTKDECNWLIVRLYICYA